MSRGESVPIGLADGAAIGEFGFSLAGMTKGTKFSATVVLQKDIAAKIRTAGVKENETMDEGLHIRFLLFILELHSIS